MHLGLVGSLGNAISLRGMGATSKAASLFVEPAPESPQNRLATRPESCWNPAGTHP